MKTKKMEKELKAALLEFKKQRRSPTAPVKFRVRKKKKIESLHSKEIADLSDFC